MLGAGTTWLVFGKNNCPPYHLFLTQSTALIGGKTRRNTESRHHDLRDLSVRWTLGLISVPLHGFHGHWNPCPRPDPEYHLWYLVLNTVSDTVMTHWMLKEWMNQESNQSGELMRSNGIYNESDLQMQQNKVRTMKRASTRQWMCYQAWSRSSAGSTCELVRNGEPQALPQTLESEFMF